MEDERRKMQPSSRGWRYKEEAEQVAATAEEVLSPAVVVVVVAAATAVLVPHPQVNLLLTRPDRKEEKDEADDEGELIFPILPFVVHERNKRHENF